LFFRKAFKGKMYFKIMREILSSKIHKATVTEADLNYVGSITIDEDLEPIHIGNKF